MVKGHIATMLQAAFLNESTFKKGGRGGWGVNYIENKYDQMNRS
jgi:hypothetical protein